MADVTDLTEVAARNEKERQAAQEAEHEMNGNGSAKSIEDMAAEGGVEDEEGQTLLDFGDHLNLSIKGKRPTESQLKIRPVSRDISGQLGDKGDDETYAFLVVGRIHKIELPYKRDESGRVIGKIRRHILDPADIVRVTDEEAEAILTRMDGD